MKSNENSTTFNIEIFTTFKKRKMKKMGIKQNSF